MKVMRTPGLGSICKMTNTEQMPCIHFVGFKGDEFTRVKRAFGPPDFIHRVWDGRAKSMIMDWDTVVFARGTELDTPKLFNFDDSQVM